MRPFTLPIAFLTILSAAGLLHPHTVSAELTVPTERLVVDFTNRESRSISLRLGSSDGITAEMNFAVIDSTGRQIAEFYPHEIMTDRFWSGPLNQESFTKVRIGDPVIRVELNRDQALRLREEFRRRLTFLRKERRIRKLELLGEEKIALEEQINDLDVESFRLDKDLRSVQAKLKRERSLVKRDVDDLQEQIDELRDERSELASEREDLLDRRDLLLRRSDPPQDRIGDLNAEIADLDREIGQYNIEIEDHRDEIRSLREDTRALEEEVREIRDQKRDLGLEKRELNLELDGILHEMEELQRQR